MGLYPDCSRGLNSFSADSKAGNGFVPSRSNSTDCSVCGLPSSNNWKSSLVRFSIGLPLRSSTETFTMTTLVVRLKVGRRADCCGVPGCCGDCGGVGGIDGGGPCGRTVGCESAGGAGC